MPTPTPTNELQMDNLIDQQITIKTTFHSISPSMLGTLLKDFRAFISSFFIKSSEKGEANGVAELDNTGKVPSGQLPSGIGGGGSNISDVKLVTASRNYEASDANKLLVLTGNFRLTIENDVPLCFSKGDQFAIYNLGTDIVHVEKPNEQQLLFIAQNEIVHFVVVEYLEIVEEVEVSALFIKPISATKYDTLDSKLKTGFKYLLDNQVSTTSGQSVETVIEFSSTEINAAPADPVIYLPITLADFQSNNLIVAIKYTLLGTSAIEHLSLTATNDGLSPELWKNENVGGLGDNKIIQNVLDRSDFSNTINFLKIKFKIDESENNPQDFTGVVGVVKVQLNPIIF